MSNLLVQMFITGPPKSGKTTLIKRLIKECSLKYSGFITEEIIEDNIRVGFSYTTSENKTGILAHVNFKSVYSVGKYGVMMNKFEKDILHLLKPNNGLIIIDEFGKMEIYSKRFLESIEKLIVSDQAYIISIGKRLLGYYHNWKIKNQNLKLYHISISSRQLIFEEIKKFIQSG